MYIVLKTIHHGRFLFWIIINWTGARYAGFGKTIQLLWLGRHLTRFANTSAKKNGCAIRKKGLTSFIYTTVSRLQKLDNQNYKTDKEQLIVYSWKLKVDNWQLKVNHQNYKVDNQLLTIDNRHQTIDNQLQTIDNRNVEAENWKLVIDSQQLTVENQNNKPDSQNQTFDNQLQTIDSQLQTIDTQNQNNFPCKMDMYVWKNRYFG